MTNNNLIYIGTNLRIQPDHEIKGEVVSLLGEPYYKIQNYDAIDPFFMSITSSSNHWLFISSSGGLSAGRINAENSLFPYYTVDKLSENYENTGSKAIIRVKRENATSLWEPFSIRNEGVYHINRNIYKNVPGTSVIFEEKNHSLGLNFRYAWRTSEKYGFIKTTWLENTNATESEVEFLDGIQNVLSTNVPMDSQSMVSCLLDAYKRAELVQDSSMAIFSLSSRLTDLAEPSESLRATIVYQVGIDSENYLISSQQLDNFRSGSILISEKEVRGQRGSYFVHAKLKVMPDEIKSWHIVSDILQDSEKIIRLLNFFSREKISISDLIENDIALNKTFLNKIVASVDGLQLTGNSLPSNHHYANTMFNAMRGGIFMDNYQVHIDDFIEFISQRNKSYVEKYKTFISQLNSIFSLHDLQDQAWENRSSEMILLSYAYLPISFSRRHGDPSRPWNRFEIDTVNPDGSLKIRYEGNWRDIFQNWEALAYSFPEYVENMISVFLNSTTFDGYNPYRINQNGIEWEIPEPGNPWANIGYWSDHQIIYIQKLLEISSNAHPGFLQKFITHKIFSFANIPYRIKKYQDLLEDPFDSIIFDWDLEARIVAQVSELGADGKLILNHDGSVYQVNLIEKFLTLLLAKLVNFVPDGGIWMNTQRPEWNDANNALVGNGLSIVTLCYLLRLSSFFVDLLAECPFETVEISRETDDYFKLIFQTLIKFQDCVQQSFDDKQRREFMDSVGQAGSNFRWNFYSSGVSCDFVEIPISEIINFLNLTKKYIEGTLENNKRVDNLFHSYNILNIHHKAASVSHLYEMLEGQVAILSSHMLSIEETISLLDSLRNSQLYCSDQKSYLLYPDKDLPGFLQRNIITPENIDHLKLVTELIIENDNSLFIKDINGNFHFNGDIKNVKDVRELLVVLGQNPKFTNLVRSELDKIISLFEKVFHHNEFTGRSGTFFAYEGLGSVYWHMVSKLLLAVQESIFRFRDDSGVGKIIDHYREIRDGLGFNKPPDEFGAFPTDPYSHTPKGRGASQPGMTGLVKEEILTRIADLGYLINDGRIRFDFILLDEFEFIDQPSTFNFWNVSGQNEEINMEKNSFAYTICQTPFIVRLSNKNCTEVIHTDGTILIIEGHELDMESTNHIFKRDGFVHHIIVHLIIDK